MTTLADELEALERRGWDALCGPEGTDFYADLMADDGVMVFPDMLLDRTATIEAIDAASPWSSFELTDLRVIEATGDVGLVLYRADARRDAEAPYRALMTTVYVRRDGRWRLILHQQSPSASST